MPHSSANGYINGAAARPLRDNVEFPINTPVLLTFDYDDRVLSAKPDDYGDENLRDWLRATTRSHNRHPLADESGYE